MIILLDMDEVLAAWGKRFDELGRLAGLFDDPAYPAYEERTRWDLHVGLSPEQKRIQYDLLRMEGFYAGIEPMPGALDAALDLMDRGHEVFIVSSPYLANETCASEKLAWVDNYLGGDWPDRTILTLDKTAIRGDLLVDDKPDIRGRFDRDWEQVCFGKNKYSDTTEALRMREWHEVLSYSEEFEG